MDDWQLLQAYAAGGAQASFAELVRRHVDLVYSAALRQLRDVQLAEDAVQVVFALLAQRAGQLQPPVVVAGWLMQSTRYVCLDIARSRARRAKLEQRASSASGQRATCGDGRILLNHAEFDPPAAATPPTSQPALGAASGDAAASARASSARAVSAGK